MTLTTLRQCFAVLSLFALGQGVACGALTHAKFDSPFTAGDVVPLATSLTVVDVWGAQNAVPVTGELGVSPIDGDQMLRVADDGVEKTAVAQLVGVEHLAAAIDAGDVVANWITCFNSPAEQSGATGRFFLEYYDAAATLITTSIVEEVSGMDGDPSTWHEFALVNAPLPTGTRRVRAVFEFDAASLDDVPVFADKFTLLFSSPAVPEPASALMLLAGLVAVSRTRR